MLAALLNLNLQRLLQGFKEGTLSKLTTLRQCEQEQ